MEVHGLTSSPAPRSLLCRPMDEGPLLTPQVVQDPLLGTEIQGRYRVLQRLGAGGMGVVYLGEHILIRRKVAIKTLHPHYAADPSVVSRFHREALAATAVGNEHIVEVTDMGHLSDGSLFMVLEYLEGHNFGEEISRQGALPVGRVSRIICQMCDALTAVHEKGIVHRDLKPDNIFLVKRSSNPDFVKILDFGISKFKSSLDGKSANLTNTGATLGTPHFMAPEQAEGRGEIDLRADIYALGGIMFYALSGRHPFDADTFLALMMKICTEPAPSVRAHLPHLPAELEFAIARCLAKNPQERYQSCAELKAALLPFCDYHDDVRIDVSAYGETVVSSAVPAVSSDVRTAAAGSGAQFESSQSGLTATQPSEDHHVQARVRARRAMFAATAALALVGAAAGVVFVLRSADPSAQEAEGAVARVDPEPSAAPSAEAEASKPAPTANVHVKISTTPSEAVLTLDGHRIANPFDGELPQSTEPKRLEARLEGYDSLSQEIVLEFSQTVRLTLSKKGSSERQGQAVVSRMPAVTSKDAPAPVARSKSDTAARKPPTPPAPTSTAVEQTPKSAPAPAPAQPVIVAPPKQRSLRRPL